jgi:hypothetical protein
MTENEAKLEVSAQLTGTITEAPPVPPAPEDLAAAFFRLQGPRLKELLSKLNAKQLRRVVLNACSYPFTEKAYNPRTQTEKQTLYLIHEMVLNRSIMQLHFEMQKAEEAANKQETNPPEGEKNGL